MTETLAEREARWARERARQLAYASSPAVRAERAERIASGLCVIESPVDGGVMVCVTHDCQASFDHYLATRPSHSAFGIATND